MRMDMVVRDLDGIITVSRRENGIIFCQEIDRPTKSIFVASRRKSNPKMRNREIICYDLSWISHDADVRIFESFNIIFDYSAK